MQKTFKKKPDTSIVIYGKHSVLAALQNKARRHIKLIATQEAYNKLGKEIADQNIRIEIKKDHELSSLYPDIVHQGLVLHSHSIFLWGIESLSDVVSKHQSCITVLDQVTDPQNIGSIIRSALAFNIDAIIMLEHHSPAETSSMIKASSGAIESVPVVRVTNLASSLRYLKQHNYWVTGLDSNTDSYISKTAINKKTVLILGSEGSGLRQLTKENCDFIVKLPMSDRIDSINVGSAAAIAMYEYFKTTINS